MTADPRIPRLAAAEYRIDRVNRFLDQLWGEMYAMPSDAPVNELETIATRFSEMETFANRAVAHSRGKEAA